MENNNILHPEEFDSHIISPYIFKRVSEKDNIVQTEIHKTNTQENTTKISKKTDQETPNNNAQSPTNLSKEDISNMSVFHTNMMDKIETLATKLDDVKNNFKNNNQAQPSSEELQKSYQDGFNAGKKESTKEARTQNDEIKERFTQSITLITNYAKKADTTISSLENELAKASIDIAQEVMQTQVEESSSKVALEISRNLLSSIKEAASITLKVSVYDYDYLKEQIQDENITIEKDLAIAKGGVMIFSDVMNIDGTLKERFSKIKSAFYGENK